MTTHKKIKTHKKHSSKDTVFFMSKEKFAHSVYPVIAGVPTAIVVLYFFDFGQAYQDVLKHVISPVITGITSGFILQAFSRRR